MAKKKSHLKKSVFAAVLLIFAVCLFFAAKQPVLEYLYPQKYSEYVEKYAKEYNIDEYLLYSVIRTESSFDPNAVSVAGARGLTQITEDTFNWLLTKTGESYDFDDLFDAELSVKYSALFLSILHSEYNCMKTEIAAYHAGMGHVSSWLGDSQYSEDGINLITTPISDTNHYISKVSDAYEMYIKIYREE